jgi:hypothetical protein
MTRAIIPLLILVVSGCTELSRVVKEIDTRRPLTQTEVVRGLKQALVIGVDSAASRLSAKDGYYGDRLVKINLPGEAEIVTNNISRIPGGEKLVEDVILRINRSAEDAAREAVPVFAKAVTNMSIHDGFEILRGENNAATIYLQSQTYDELFKLYQPKIKASLDKKIVGGISTNESWDKLTSHWNKMAGSTLGKLADLQTVENQLDK